MTSRNKAPSIPNPVKQPYTDSGPVHSFLPPVTQYSDLEQRISALEEKTINFDTDIVGLLETVSTAPSGVPKNVYDQIKIYKNGSTYRLYWYDAANGDWFYATGTLAS